ncbi:hypothetical protein [Moorena sp. SIO2C4]|nr:hypothetical protein [Moorena sp. SIO2C4]
MELASCRFATITDAYAYYSDHASTTNWWNWHQASLLLSQM